MDVILAFYTAGALATICVAYLTDEPPSMWLLHTVILWPITLPGEVILKFFRTLKKM